MKNNSVLLKPHITEKSIHEAGNNKYTFLVSLSATKKQIAKAVKELFKVDVLSVKTIILKGKTRKVGQRRLLKNLSPRKKAVVEIKKGQKIDLFETGGVNP